MKLIDSRHSDLFKFILKYTYTGDDQCNALYDDLVSQIVLHNQDFIPLYFDSLISRLLRPIDGMCLLLLLLLLRLQ